MTDFPIDPLVAPLRIAMVAPPWLEIPPVAYGGIEPVVAGLVDSLVARGHEVTLVASGEARTTAQRTVTIFDKPPSNRIGEALPEVIGAAVAARAIADLEIDLVHDHTLAGPLLAWGRRTPTVVTAHGPVTGESGLYYSLMSDTVKLIAISDSQRTSAPEVHFAGRVYNGIDVASFTVQERKQDYVAWIGRFTPDKGPDEAIRAARALGLRIILAGKCSEPAEFEYYESVVKPMLGPDAEFVGEVDATSKRALMEGAQCLVFPLQWDEPFGVVMVESMACGTPVAAFARGSVPEVVADGVSGAVVPVGSDFTLAVTRAIGLDPWACRRHVEERFDLGFMARGYEKVYLETLGR